MFGLSASAAGIRLRPQGLGGSALMFGVALMAGFAVGCPLELERGVSCGDGWWDPQYEACDPRDPASFIDACRDQGWVVDASCDPTTCEILATAQDCALCGDGVASHTEECDGDDLRGASCSAGVGEPACKSDCTLDHSLCPPVCGDGIVGGSEECEPTPACATDDDCPPGKTCYLAFGQCVALGENFAPNLACGAYSNETDRIEKPYTSGTIDRCAETCLFGRNDCGFCGDGVLDPSYSDLKFPTGEDQSFPAEKCDGDQVLVQTELEDYCESLCPVDSPVNGDVVILCDFECNAGCSGFAPPQDIIPGPGGPGCCLDKGSPCPSSEFDTEGVPEFPCCSWLEKPDWLAGEKCVPDVTGKIPVTQVCP